MEVLESMTEFQPRADSQHVIWNLHFRMKRHKKNTDSDYVEPPERAPVHLPHRKGSARVPSFLTIHENEIREGQRLRLGPTAIASRICAKNGLAEGAIQGKQVSNWLNYHKISRGQKTTPVSLKNANLPVNPADSKCMLL
jgi:hypothetical protein